MDYLRAGVLDSGMVCQVDVRCYLIHTHIYYIITIIIYYILLILIYTYILYYTPLLNLSP